MLSYYHAYAKRELPYYSIRKSSEEVRNIIINAHLNLDDNLIDIMNDDDIDDTEVTDEKNDLLINEVLNLDAEAFIKNLDEIIEDSEDMEEEDVDVQSVDKSESEIEDNENWDPNTEADEIINSM
jgi:hypothetical protein